MKTQMECYLSPSKWPADAQLRKDAIALGFAESGYVRPRTYFRDGRVDMDALIAAFDALDERIPPWVPLCVNFQHFAWYWEGGPISGRQYVNVQRWVAERMIERYQRLIPNCGSPHPIHPLAAEAARLWSSAALSGHWSWRDNTGEYLWNAKQRMKLASPYGLQRMIYVTPLVYPKNREDTAKRMTSGRWGRVLDLCEWAVDDDKTTKLGFWLNRKLPDSFIRNRLAEMAERLG